MRHAGERVRSVIKFIDAVAVVFQVDLHEVGNFALVVHNEYFIFHFVPPTF
ncbi:hypothetical protein SDC9_206304 [bioreactor metagenome]|uniref:Uncharacterized protein n=1 Tax=bioreactor metagenome TaxID=1076179 RepID=A0A645J5C7_9ZZZZ